jgi:hypothetical protein
LTYCRSNIRTTLTLDLSRFTQWGIGYPT